MRGLGGRQAALVLFAALLAGACGQGGGRGQAAACSAPKPLAAPAELPSDLPVTADLELTALKTKRGFVSVQGTERTTVKSALMRFHKAVTGSGFEVINTDYEGFEAEIFFARASASQGVVSIRKGPCRGDVSVSVVYDPIDTERGRKALDKTRSLSQTSRG